LNTLKSVLLGAASIGVLASATAVVAQDNSVEEDFAFEELVVTAGRLPTKVTSIPHSITILSSEDLNKQAKITTDLGAMLAAQIPGLAVSSQTNSNFTQTMRGRKPAVLVDGVLIGTPLRDGGRELRTISPAAVGSIEVIRGSTSAYGNGGAGGIINYVTKRPSDGETEIKLEGGIGGSLSDFGSGLRYITEASIAGKADAFDYIVTGYYEDVGIFRDADGDIIAPDPQGQGGIADSENYNVYVKLGLDISDEQRVEVSGMLYKSEQDTAFGQDVSTPGDRTQDIKQIAGEIPESVQVLGTPLDPRRIGQSTDNKVYMGKYTHDDIWGSSLSLTAYYQEVDNVFSWFEGFPAFDATSADPLLNTPGGQSQISSEKTGVRLDFVTPLNVFESGQLLWGVDYGKDKTSQPLVDGRTFAPNMDQEALAGFFQLELGLTDWLTFRGGLRYEDMSVNVKDFTALFTGTAIEGGTVNYNQLVVNAGAVANVTDGIDLFAGFSQGFSVTDIGRLIRVADFSGITSLAALNPEPQLINNYEIGMRGHWQSVNMSLAGFVSTSEQGTTLNAVTLFVDRAPERIWGLEATVDVDVSDILRVGGSYSWVNGKTDTIGDGNYDTNLNSSRIAPAKITAYVEYDFWDEWSTRLQLLNSGSQDRFSEKALTVQGFAETRVESATTLDLVVSGPVGPGRVSLAVQNLLNNDYYTPDSYIFTDLIAATPDFVFAKAPGATFTLKYGVEF